YFDLIIRCQFVQVAYSKSVRLVVIDVFSLYSRRNGSGHFSTVLVNACDLHVVPTSCFIVRTRITWRRAEGPTPGQQHAEANRRKESQGAHYHTSFVEDELQWLSSRTCS